MLLMIHKAQQYHTNRIITPALSPLCSVVTIVAAPDFDAAHKNLYSSDTHTLPQPLRISLFDHVD
jgi:hypothetical protein